MNPILVTTAEAGSPDWHAARRTGIGASEAGAACGGFWHNEQYIPFDPWKQPIDLYYELRAESEGAPTNRHMRRGTIYEPSIIQHYQEEFGVALDYPMGVYRHPEWEFMLASPDAQEDASTGVEIKTTGISMIHRVESEGLQWVFPKYVLQCQQQIAVMNWERCWLSFIVDWQFHKFEITRNEQLIAMIAERERDLWERVQAGNPPEIQVFHPRAMETLTRSIRSQTPKSSAIRLSEAGVEAWRKFKDLTQQIKSLEDQREAVQCQVVAEIGGSEAGLLPDGRAVRKRVFSNTVGLTETSGVGLDVMETSDTIEVRFSLLKRFFAQKAIVKTTGDDRQSEFLHLASGNKIVVMTAEPEDNKSDHLPEKDVIRLYDPSVVPVEAAKAALDFLGI